MTVVPQLRTEADMAEGLAHLGVVDPTLLPIIAKAQVVPLRQDRPGFEGLARIICAQQISRFAAEAIWNRLSQTVSPFAPRNFLGTDEEALRLAGLSRAKIETLTGIATACVEGFDMDRLAGLPADEAIAAMTAHKGIGQWTAEVYLLFCIGHADVFPAGDLALMTAACDAFQLDHRPTEKELRRLAERWSPWRGVGAKLLWRYYAVTRRDATPVGATA